MIQNGARGSSIKYILLQYKDITNQIYAHMIITCDMPKDASSKFEPR